MRKAESVGCRCVGIIAAISKPTGINVFQDHIDLIREGKSCQVEIELSGKNRSHSVGVENGSADSQDQVGEGGEAINNGWKGTSSM